VEDVPFVASSSFLYYGIHLLPASFPDTIDQVDHRSPCTVTNFVTDPDGQIHGRFRYRADGSLGRRFWQLHIGT